MDLFGPHKSREDAPYGDVDTSKMTLRDRLAADRTNLSSQNTFLAYIRTALTLFVAGVTFIRFFDQRVVEIIGWAFIPTGVVTFFVGFFRYNRFRILLKRLQR
jgi:putative membrane protein